MYRRKRDLYDRFMKKVFPEPNTGCWIWGGAQNRDGYGSMWVHPSTMLAHRVSFNLFNNVVLAKKELVLHKCNNKFCVNPDHLYTGTHRDNSIQAFRQGLLRNCCLKSNRSVSKRDPNGYILETYESINQAAIANNISHSCIIDSCKGRREFAGGFRWSYA